MAKNQSHKFVNYENPPVVETVLGVQFEPLNHFTNAHLGAFWRELGSSAWPIVADASPIISQFERFSGKGKWASFGARIMLTQEAATRLQITNRDKDRMIQLQNSRLHLNWLGRKGAEYPRYSAMREEFIGVYSRLKDFLATEGIKEIKPNQWEVTYVNQIPRGTVWNEPADWDFCKLLASIPNLPDLVQGESFNGEWHFIIPGGLGRLHAQWQHAVQSGDADDELIRLTLTARGPLQLGDSDVEPTIAGLDLGHKTIVVSFRDLMSDDANRFWGLKNAPA